MKKNILLKTNILICAVIICGFLMTAILSYKANYSDSLKSMERVSLLTTDSIYHQLSAMFVKPVNVSVTMANDSLLKDLLEEEKENLNRDDYIYTMTQYLAAYREEYAYDSVFLVSNRTKRYYCYDGPDRILKAGDPENKWYYDFLEGGQKYSVNIDNDEVKGARNEVTAFVNCKIFNEQGKIQGVVGVGVRITNLQKILQRYEEKFGVKIYMISQSGKIEISTEYTGYENVNYFELQHYKEDVKDAILQWKENKSNQSFWASVRNTKEKKNYLATRYLSEPEWHLVVEQNNGVLIGKLKRQMAVTVVILILILMVILFIITYVIRSFNSRMIALTKESEKEHSSLFEKVTNQLYENIYELDITNNCPANRATEEYFESLGAPHGTPYNTALEIIAEKQIKEEYRQGYLNMFLPQNVLRSYEEGTETLRYEFMITQNGEDYYWMQITAQIVRWESDGSLHMLTYRQNIDADKRREQQIKKLAQMDEMTGFLTKSATERNINKAIDRNREGQFAFFIFDIDNFKQANDRFGHAFGDEVIREFTDCIRKQFRETDILGRVGGDEFVVFTSPKGEDWVKNKAEELTTVLNKTYCSGDSRWKISTSIGIYYASGQGNDYHSFYINGDKALYKAKKQGKNKFIFARE